MTPAEAARILELPADAGSAAIESRFLELRRKLEDKIAKAPTPGLQAKYRDALAQLTEAFESLTLAADGSDLPMLKIQPAGGPAPSRADSPAPLATSHLRPPARSKSGIEFIVVAVVAVVLLAAGGWWVMKTRAENEEKSRRAAEARLAAERTAEIERQTANAARIEKERLAEAKRAADEARRAEQERLAAEKRQAEDNERARVESLVADIRTKLVDFRMAWESYQREAQRAEREAGELKSELQSQRDAPATARYELSARAEAAARYSAWLSDQLPAAPPRLTLAKIDEMLSARRADEAQTALARLPEEFKAFQAAIAANHEQAFAVDGELVLDSQPTGLPFDVIDAFGRHHQGTTPASITNMAPGPGSATVFRPQYENVTNPVSIQTGQRSIVTVSARSQPVIVRAEPDVEIWSGGRFYGRGQCMISDAPPREYQMELHRQGFRHYAFKFTVQQSGGPRTLDFKFSELSAQNITCDACQGRGSTEVEKTCTACNGKGRFRCEACMGKGNFGIYNGRLVRCFSCGGRGYKKCTSCDGNGTVTEHPTCARCGGDGLLSKLDLQ